MAKLPAFQFYPGDWLKDPALSRVSSSARGVWMDCLCLMFECEERGKLTTGGIPWTPDDLAKSIRGKWTENRICIDELLAHRVLRRDDTGIMFSARMVRDEQTRIARAEAGKLGAISRWNEQSDETAESGQKDGFDGKSMAPPMAKPMANGMAKRGSSSSSSFSSSETFSEPAAPVAQVDEPEPKKPRKHCPLWDAIKAEWFAGVADDKLPKSHRTRLGRLRREFAACEGGDPMKAAERLPSVSRAYREKHPTWEHTPEAILKRWHELNGHSGKPNKNSSDRVSVQNRLDAELLAAYPPDVVAKARAAAWSPTVDAAAAEVIREWEKSGKVKPC